MSDIWVASMILQWVVIALLCVVVVSVLRQLGAVAARLKPGEEAEPASEPASLLDLGARLEPEPVRLIDGGQVTVGGQGERPMLVAFVSSGCSSCPEVEAGLEQLVLENGSSSYGLLVVLAAPRFSAEQYVQSRRLDRLPTALLDDFPRRYSPGRTPWAFALTPDGLVAARGTPRRRQDLEEMIDAARTFEAGASRRTEWGEVAAPPSFAGPQAREAEPVSDRRVTQA